MAKVKMLSADAHIVEPGDLWQKYMDPKSRDRAPRMEFRPETGDTWVIEGLTLPNIARMGAAGLKSEDVSPQPRFDKDVRKGGWEPKARLADMAVDGVDGQILYPTVGFWLYGIEDPDLVYASFEAYNNWVRDFTEGNEKYFGGVGFLCLDDIDRAIGEMTRCKEMGMPAVNIPLHPDPNDPEQRPYSGDYYDRFWAAAQDLDMPLVMHTGSSRGVHSAARAGTFYLRTPKDATATQVAGNSNVPRFIATMILSGTLDRFPRLRIVPTEFETGWAAFLIKRMDDRLYRNRGRTYLEKMAMKPSEYFQRNFALTFMDDEVAVHCREIIGVDNIMWSDDYPHIDGPWPESQAVQARVFPEGRVPEEHKEKILGGNAARIFNYFN